MRTNTANEIDAVRLHLVGTHHAIANSLTIVTLAVDEWDTLSDKTRVRFQAYWLETLDAIAAEINAARSIVRTPGNKRQ